MPASDFQIVSQGQREAAPVVAGDALLRKGPDQDSPYLKAITLELASGPVCGQAFCYHQMPFVS